MITGHVVVTKHELQESPVGALWPFDSGSILGKRKGQKIDRGEIVGWIGGKKKTEDGAPLAFSIVMVRPHDHDMPGVVDPKDRSDAWPNIQIRG